MAPSSTNSTSFPWSPPQLTAPLDSRNPPLDVPSGHRGQRGSQEGDHEGLNDRCRHLPFSLVQYFYTSSRDVADLVVDQNHMTRRSVACILEIERELRPGPSIDPRVT